jgi:hypothetical protein
MLNRKFRLFRRTTGIFYWQENEGTQQGSLRTRDRVEAERLLHSMNESHREPMLNLAMGRAYLSAHDPRMVTRTWQDVMDQMATHGIETTQLRCARALRSKAYATRRVDSIDAARTILLNALEQHSASALLNYNLACSPLASPSSPPHSPTDG